MSESGHIEADHPHPRRKQTDQGFVVLDHIGAVGNKHHARSCGSGVMHADNADGGFNSTGEEASAGGGRAAPCGAARQQAVYE